MNEAETDARFILAVVPMELRELLARLARQPQGRKRRRTQRQIKGLRAELREARRCVEALRATSG